MWSLGENSKLNKIKQWFKKLWNPLKAELFVLVAILLIYFSLENFITPTFLPLVKTFWSQVRPSYTLDVLMLSLIFYWVYRIYQDRRFSKHLLRFETLLVALAIVYLHEKQSGTNWQFTATQLFESIAYFDLMLIIPLALGIRLVVNTRSKVLEAPLFLQDQPIGGVEKSEDDLGYYDYANSLAKKLEVGNYLKSFALGICGSWGSGKTSFVNILHNQFDKKKIIWVNFNPWLGDKPPFEEFFDAVESAAQKVSPSLSRLISQYAQTLEANTSHSLIRLALNKLGMVTGKKSQSEYITEISKLLVALDRKLIIVVDDLDRLEKDEILTLLKIIRNTANFKNTIFISLYDKMYLGAMLTELRTKGSAEFSDKVFQLEIHLPQFDKSILTTNLFTILSERFPSLEEELHQTLLKTKPGYAEEFLKSLESKRDVTKLANSFIINYSQLPGDLNVKDLLMLELLKLKHFEVYSDLREHKENHLGEHYSESNAQSFHFYLNTTYSPISMDGSGLKLTYEQDSVKRILNTLFDLSKSETSGNFPKNSISFPSHYNRYFFLSMNETAFSEQEWIALRKKPEHSLIEKVGQILTSEKGVALSEKLFKVKVFDNPSDFEKVIKSQLLAIEKYEGKTDPFSSRAKFLTQSITDQFESPNSLYQNKSALRAFIFKLFEDKLYGFKALVALVAGLKKQSSILDETEIEKVENELLTAHLEGAVNFPESFWKDISPIFENKSYTTATDNGSRQELIKVIPGHLASEIKKFGIKYDFKGLMESMICPAFEEEGHFKVVSGIVISLFTNSKNLLNFLQKHHSNKPESKEMIEFLETFEMKNIGIAPFPFKILNPENSIIV